MPRKPTGEGSGGARVGSGPLPGGVRRKQAARDIMAKVPVQVRPHFETPDEYLMWLINSWTPEVTEDHKISAAQKLKASQAKVIPPKAAEKPISKADGAKASMNGKFATRPIDFQQH